MEIDIELSDEQLDEIAEALYYGSDLVTEVKEYIASHQEEYELFLEKERRNAAMKNDS